MSVSILQFIYSPQFLLTQSLCSIFLALFLFCNKFICTFFRNHIYMVSFTFVFLFLSYFTQHDNLKVHLYCCKWHAFLLFYGWVIIHLLSSLFLCWWTFRLHPCPGYYKQCCNEHWGTRVSFRSGFLGVHAQQWDCWVIWQFYFQFFQKSPHCFP